MDTSAVKIDSVCEKLPFAYVCERFQGKKEGGKASNCASYKGFMEYSVHISPSRTLGKMKNCMGEQVLIKIR